MVFIAILVALALLLTVQNRLYRKRGLQELQYTSEFGAREAFCGDYIYMFETLSNAKKLPLPYVKVNTDLDEGLVFTVLEEVRGERRISEVSGIQSIFVMKADGSIRRRWRLRCKKRGVYLPPTSLLIASDLFGFETLTASSGRRDDDEDRALTVLPSVIDLASSFYSPTQLSGDVISNHCPVTDPMTLAGAREYVPDDPMNRINWKSSAVHAALMVNVEERTVRHTFGVVLNMSSRIVEKDPHTPSDTDAIERCITVAASIFDSAAERDIPVRLYANTAKTPLLCESVEPEGDGAGILLTPFMTGRGRTLELLRILAHIKMEISIPAETMLDHIAAHPELYADCMNLVIVSAYIDSRITGLYETMRAYGTNVICYLTTGRNDTASIPQGMEIYYRT